MPAALRRLRLRAADAVRFSPLARAAVLAKHAARALAAGTPEARLDAAIEGYRMAQGWPPGGWLVRRARRAVAAGTPSTSAAARVRGGAWSQQQTALDRTLILKTPANGGERGVLLVFGEYNWLRMLAALPDVRAVQQAYDWVLIAGRVQSPIAPRSISRRSLVSRTE